MAKSSAAVAETIPSDPPTEEDIRPAEAPKDMIEMVQDRLVYKPEQCKEFPIQGLLLTRLPMPAGEGGQPWSAYVVRLTRPTKAVDREGKVHTAKAGTEVLLPATARLDDPKVIGAALHPNTVREFWIQPDYQENIGGGRKMWHYKFRYAKESQVRTDEMKMFLQAARVPELTAGGPPAGSEKDPWDK